MNILRIVSSLAFILAAGVLSAAAAQSRVDNDYTTTEIILETNGFVAGETTWFAIRQEVREDWHVFWTNPGDAGLPLDLNWELPQGFEAGDILHPIPGFIPVGPLASFAHEGTPVFLIPVAAPENLVVGETISIAIDATWQACEEICVPENGRFEFTAPVIDVSQRENIRPEIFDGARAALPVPFNDEATLALRNGSYVLDIPAIEGLANDGVFFFPGPEGLIEPAGRQRVTIADGVMSIAMNPGYLDGYAEDAVYGVLTYLDGRGARRGAAITADVPEPIVKPSSDRAARLAAADANIPLLLAMAFAGGMILNLMPCVFPILFVKAASLMQSGGENRAAVRLHGLLYTAGVLSTFLLIGGLLLALRAGGAQLGWGFHLQSPAVVALSAYVLLLVGLNLSGVYIIGERFAGTGQSLAGRRGGLGAFFTGALTVVVAAPCIGPLLSAPLGAALLQPAIIGMAIFVTLALGLATPYLALSLSPALGRLLPRPGPWMKVLKQALAFPVFAAAAYFLWIFSQQSDASGLAFVLSGAVFLAFSAWLFEISKGDGVQALIVRALSAFFVLAALAPLLRLEADQTSTAGDGEAYGAVTAEPFNAAALDEYRAAGIPVFIDFTAAWCVTCQFDKVRVFSSRDLARAFDRNGVVLMVADWTIRDPEITAALQSFGASGVPLYVYYPTSGAAQIMPLPLTQKSVMAAISGQ